MHISDIDTLTKIFNPGELCLLYYTTHTASTNYWEYNDDIIVGPKYCYAVGYIYNITDEVVCISSIKDEEDEARSGTINICLNCIKEIFKLKPINN